MLLHKADAGIILRLLNEMLQLFPIIYYHRFCATRHPWRMAS